MNILNQSEKVPLLAPPAKKKKNVQQNPVDLDNGGDTGSEADDCSGSEFEEDLDPTQPTTSRPSQPSKQDRLELLPGEKAKIVPKSYLHLGVEWGLTGKSPGISRSFNFPLNASLSFHSLIETYIYFQGLVYRHTHYRMLKIVARLDPSILSTTFIDQAKAYDPISSEAWRAANSFEGDDNAPEEGSLEDESDRMTGNFWAQLDTTNAIPETCFWIDVNIDGIQLFKNSQRPQVFHSLQLLINGFWNEHIALCVMWSLCL